MNVALVKSSLHNYAQGYILKNDDIPFPSKNIRLDSGQILFDNEFNLQA